MYDEILVPTDGSPAAEAALDHAIDLASTYGARLHALYIVDAAAFSSVEAGAELVVDALEEEGQRAVERVHDAGAEAGVDVVASVQSGSASKSILRYVDDNDVDLVVMGTHGRRGVERFLLGSVTERVVRSADVPVMTVRMPDEE
jgi:nucleotide-binding universal stress UspA family protein